MIGFPNVWKYIMSPSITSQIYLHQLMYLALAYHIFDPILRKLSKAHPSAHRKHFQ